MSKNESEPMTAMKNDKIIFIRKKTKFLFLKRKVVCKTKYF